MGIPYVASQGPTLPSEIVLPEGKLVRTASGGTDALKKALVDLKRYSFSGYIKTILQGPGGGSIGYVVVSEGTPDLALHATEKGSREGKAALKAVWEDSYAPKCTIEIHAKVDIEKIRASFPNAGLERVARAAPPAPKVTKPTPRTVPPETQAKVRAWRDAGYDVETLEAVLRAGGEAAAAALGEFETAIARMEPLLRDLDGITEPALHDRVAALREGARDPLNANRVAAEVASLQEEAERLSRAAQGPRTEEDRERELQDRARRVFDMIVRHRAAEGKPADISEVQVARALEGKPTTRDERTNLIRQYTFDTYVVGPSNRFAHAASVAVARSPHSAYNPLFVTSGSGLGKTHLMNAIGNAILSGSGEARVLYVTAEGFSNEFKEAQAAGRLQEFREKFRTLDVALLDDAHFLSGKGDVQEELFHTFNDLYNANKQIVLTSDRPPKEIPDLEDRLVSRFESGLIADIQPPEYETRVAILRRKAQDAGTPVDDEVIAYIGQRVEDNIRELGGALNRVVAFSQLMGQPVSLDLAKEVLKELREGEAIRAGARLEEAGRGIQPGHAYLIEEDRPDHAFALLRRALGTEARGLIVTRQNPKRVREKHDVAAYRILWLTERESTAVETIPPSLERIIHVIEEFMKEGERGAVMIDGVEYLVSSSSFDAVLKFLRRLIDHTSESQFVLLVSASTKTLKEQEIKNLEREMEVLAL